MALLHATATLEPSKLDVIRAWLPRQSWAADLPTDGDGLTEVGSYRFDDPAGAVGLEAIMVRSGAALFHVPLTYRAEPATGSAAPPIATMAHSALGTRYVHDGAADPAFLCMLAAVTLTGVGQAASVLLRDGRTLVRAPSVRLESSAGGGPVVAVDGFGPPVDQDGWAVVRSAELTLRVARRLSFEAGAAAGAGAGQASGAAVLTGRGAGWEHPVTLAVVEVVSGSAGD